MLTENLIHQKMKYLCGIRGLQLKHVAHMLGITLGGLTPYFRGIVPWKERQKKRIAKMLNVDRDFLFSNDEFQFPRYRAA